MAHGRYAEAIASVAAVEKLGTTDANLSNTRGVAELMRGQLEQAIAAFDKAIAANGDFLEARFNRAIALLKLKRYGDAAAEFQTVYDRPDHDLRARAAFHHALADDAAGRVDDAQIWLKRALAVDPGLDDATLYLGVLYERKRAFGDAGKLYRAYLDKHPDSLVATLRFGVAAHRAGFHDTAAKYLKQVVERAPDSMEAAEARPLLVMWSD